jgi:hypothetical protein
MLSSASFYSEFQLSNPIMYLEADPDFWKWTIEWQIKKNSFENFLSFFD